MKMFITRIVLALYHFRQWLIAQIAFGFLNLLKLFPADRAMTLADGLMRRIGPLTGRHRLVIYNLKRAFPDKSEEEIRQIALGSWGSLGRMVAEYVFLDRLFDFDPESDKPGRIEVSGIPIFLDLRDNPRPFIVFTAHSGCFELLPVAGASFGLSVTVLFRPPNNPYIGEKVFQFRAARMGKLVPSHAGSSFALARTLEEGEGSAFWLTRNSPAASNRGFSIFPCKPILCSPSLPGSSSARCIRPAPSACPEIATALKSNRPWPFRAARMAVWTLPAFHNF